MKKQVVTVVFYMAACTALLPQTAAAQSKTEYEMSTDRPDMSEASVVIPDGITQLEMGFQATRDRGSGAPSSTATPALFRIGVGSEFEIRVGSDGLLYTDAGNETGIGDLQVGFKRVLATDLALLAAVKLPTGSNAFSNDKVEYGFIVAWDKEIGGGWGLGFNYGGSLLASNATGDRNYEHFISAAFARDLTEDVGFFFDLYSFLSHETGVDEVVSFQFGFTRAVRPALQLDIFADVGLTDAASAGSIGVGFALVP